MRHRRLVKLGTALRSGSRSAADSSQDYGRGDSLRPDSRHPIQPPAKRLCRRLEWACGNAVDFRWLVEGRTIDHSTFCDFRTKFRREPKDLFGDSVSGHTLPASKSTSPTDLGSSNRTSTVRYDPTVLKPRESGAAFEELAGSPLFGIVESSLTRGHDKRQTIRLPPPLL